VARSRKGLARWSGLILVAALLPAWAIFYELSAIFYELYATVLFVLSGAVTLWALFVAPAWCGAAIRQRGQFCRNNSWGLLLGCHLRQHKWQKLKLIFVTRRWQQFTRGLWSGPSAILATVSGVGRLHRGQRSCG
jgi:hypothetical protein